MKKKVNVSRVVVALIVLAAAYRFLQVLPYPQGGGRFQESPDKRFTAQASSLTDRSYFGCERNYYEFKIESEPRVQIRRLVIEAPPEGMIDWREDGRIQWATNSQSVTYSFKGTQLTLSVQP